MLAQKLKSSCRLISVSLGFFSSYISYQYQERIGEHFESSFRRHINQLQEWFFGKSKVAAALTESYFIQYCNKLSSSPLFHQMDMTSLIITFANSENVILHDLCVKMLSAIQFPSDVDMTYYIDQCKPNTLIGLARSKFSNAKWFQQKNMTRLSYSKEEMELIVKTKIQNLLEDIEALLRHCDKEDISSCWLFDELRNEKLPRDPVANIMIDFGNERDNLLFTDSAEIPFDKHVEKYLKILYRYSSSEIISDNGVLSEGITNIITDIITLYRNDKKLMILCGNILANLAMNNFNTTRVSLFLPLLITWKNGNEFSLKIVAERCLHNLDKMKNKTVLPDGIYMLYPNIRRDIEPDIDVVLVHGIKGSPFHTWREIDSPDKTIHTNCWPQDWLPSDYQNIRVIAVQYESSLSEWSSLYPAEKDNRSLDKQAREIYKKLEKCDLGERPIVWIAHSMGGLIVKNILSSTKNDNVLHSTKGALFYSVPHLGSPIATQCEKARFILFPSVEAHELSETSMKLKKLHKEFADLVSKHGIECVDFGESKPYSLPYIKYKSIVVPETSSNVGYGKYIKLDSNHKDVCKPDSRSDIKYTEVLNMINRIINSGKNEK